MIQRLFLLSIFLLISWRSPSVRAEKPLLGGSLTWSIDRGFRTGTRKVSLTLKTAWSLEQFNPASISSCSPGDLISDCVLGNELKMFGRLCYFLCKYTDCEEKVFFCTEDTHSNTFQVQSFDSGLNYVSGKRTLEIDVAGYAVGMFAFLCFDEANGAMGPGDARWYGRGEDSGDAGFVALYPEYAGAGNYFGASFREQFSGFDYGEMNYGKTIKLLPTFVHLCCSECENANEVQDTACNAGRTRLKNYFSPAANVPLVMFVPSNAQSGAQMKYKVNDYDGHTLDLLPPRTQGNQLPTHLNFSAIPRFYGDEPREGPTIYLNSLDAGTTEGFQKSLLTVIEVQDSVWRQLESPVPRSFEDCIVDNNYDDGTVSAMTQQQRIDLVRDRLCAGASSADSEVNCRQLADPLLLDLCPDPTKPGVLQYDLYQAPPELSYEANSPFPTATSGGTVTQILTTPYAQSAAKCPPGRIPQWESDIMTEVDCYPGDECFVKLKARTGLPSSLITIKEAPGSDTIPIIDSWEGPCSLKYDTAPCGSCSSRTLCSASDPCDASILKQHQCLFNVDTPTIESVGLSQVMCFVATAVYCDTSDTSKQSEEECGVSKSCISAPVCVRFNFRGHNPVFVSPTPLTENAFDDDGNLMKGFTDIGACSGQPLEFELVAEDADEGDRVRIVVDDVQRESSFFFNNIAFESSCGRFNAYGAKRLGSNSYQHSFLHLDNAEDDSSIVAALNIDINWTLAVARQKVVYTLTPDLQNGIYIRSACTTTQMCRQRLLNADRTICGYALDNSRQRYGRWMGGRKASHNLGSYSSERHCWRVRMQSPPSFVTNSSGCVVVSPDLVASTCTPFAAGFHNVIDSTDDPAALFARIKMPYTAKLDVTFVAFDPNPEDRVSLFVLEEPGVPANMQVSRMECIARDKISTPANDVALLVAEGTCLQKCADGEQDDDGQPVEEGSVCECKVTHKAEENAGQFCPTDLSCNRAKIRLQWQPSVEDAGAGTRKVCVVARDNSKLCDGVSPTATQYGWYGDKQCMLIEVIQVEFEWAGDWIPALMQRPTPHPVYVGCTISFNVSVNETTIGASYGLQVARAESKDELAIEAKMMDVSLTPGLGFSFVTATPLLGSEGSTLTMCFSGGDKYGGLTLKGMCKEDRYKGCTADADCAVGTCATVCVVVEVQKCRYCVQDGDPLRVFRKSYFADTNWLKLWALNDETHAKLGTECAPGLDCDQDVGDVVAIDNPQLILNTPSSVGKRILWAGVLYAPASSQSFKDIACLFRTNLATIAAANPDLPNVMDAGAVVPAHHSVCIVACNKLESTDPECSKRSEGW